MGSLDHRQARRLGWLPVLQAARSDHLQTWPRRFPCYRRRMEPQRCVNPLALSRGSMRATSSALISGLAVAEGGDFLALDRRIDMEIDHADAALLEDRDALLERGLHVG